MKIILLGMKGVGKTSLGAKLAVKFGCSFIDTDCEIERRFGRGPREIFLFEGERRLREIEHKVLADLLNDFQSDGDSVIALGGGAFISSENQKILRSHGKLICLHMSRESLLKRWDGWPPICQSMEAFESYYEVRLQKLRELSCVWIDATRADLIDIVTRVCHGK